MENTITGDRTARPGREATGGGGRGITPRRRPLLAALAAEEGAMTAEYSIATLAACGFAAVLVALLKSGEVRELVMGIITSALAMGS